MRFQTTFNLFVVALCWIMTLVTYLSVAGAIGICIGITLVAYFNIIR